jgi:hypothetical protein
MIEVNWLAILLAGVSTMVVGFLWYSPKLFGKKWMAYMGYTPESMKEGQRQMAKLYLLSFVASLVTAYILSHVIVLSQYYYEYDWVMTGLTSAFFMWLGFVAPVQLTDVLFGGKKWGLFVINTGYQLVSLLVMGVILGYL